MIAGKTVSRAIDYILEHVEEELSLEDVAAHCHFSKYYFDRLFKEQTGESVYAFIKRVRLEQSAFRLKVERRPVTEIGADYGYSASNYSTAFRQHYRMTPANFRKSSRRRSMEHPFLHRETWQVESFAECDRKVTVEKMPGYRAFYERHLGSYESMSRDWGAFLKKYQAYIKPDTKFLERTYDDPAVTAPDSCLYDIGMRVGEDFPLETVRVPAARCIVYHFKGHMKYIYAAYQTLFLVWLPRTGYELDTGKGLFDIYHAVDCDTMQMEMDICLPVRER